jgi:hypothetical protein
MRETEVFLELWPVGKDGLGVNLRKRRSVKSRSDLHNSAPMIRLIVRVPDSVFEVGTATVEVTAQQILEPLVEVPGEQT